MKEVYVRNSKRKKFEKVANAFNGNLKDKSNHVIWVDYLNPTKEELLELSAQLHIEFNDLLLALDEAESPRIEELNRYSFILFNTPLYKRYVYAATLGIYLKKNYVITIHKDDLKSISYVKEKILKIRAETPSLFVHLILERVIKHFDTRLCEIEDSIDKLETEVLKKVTKDYTDIAYPLKRTLIYFRNGLRYNTEVLKLLRNGEIFNRKYDFFQDLYQDSKQLIDEEAIFRERLTDIINTHLNTMSIDLNKVMKSFTVLATLILLPSLITGFFGMNFKYIPGLEWKYGYLLAIGIMLAGVTAMMIFFYKKKWL